MQILSAACLVGVTAIYSGAVLYLRHEGYPRSAVAVGGTYLAALALTVRWLYL